MLDTSRLKQAAGYEAYGRRIDLRRSGAGYMAKCPWHDDSNPSFSVFERDGEWCYRCHGCEAGGDLLNFIQKIDKVPFKEALAKLAQECNFDIGPAQYVPFTFSQDAATKALETNNDAWEYLRSRGISHAFADYCGVGVVEHPGIGTALSIPYDRSLMPVVKFRALKPRDKDHKFRHLNDTSSSDLLYGIETIGDGNPDFVITPEVFVVESELDCLAMQAAGFNTVSVSSATACLKDGKLKIKPEHLDALRKADRIFIAVDMDKAGEACAAAF